MSLHSSCRRAEASASDYLGSVPVFDIDMCFSSTLRCVFLVDRTRKQRRRARSAWRGTAAMTRRETGLPVPHSRLHSHDAMRHVP
jgi:hypothetical protein